MTPERWRVVGEIFADALEQEPDQRQRFLDQACGQDRSLREEVQAFLASYQAAGQILEDPAVESGEPQAARFLGGQSLGGYRILQEIGHGGMGTVYLAERADGTFDKRVAVKIVKRGMNSEQVVRRFIVERQILAQLEHPSIARLLDGGTTDEGLPYFVMEHVEGESLDRYCDRHRLGVRQRLELFRIICSAVHFAHQHLVVHRDLKPGNILVTQDGIPKLLDFGIAKLLDPGLQPVLTATGQRPMTPAFASPEQFLRGPISTSSDLYSLGVLLYLLLTGRKPYCLEDRTPAEIERLVCEGEPPKPSSADGLAGTLRRRLAGDLDNIVLKALRKQPPRRYASVQELSEDVRRHLRGLPVIAREDTLAYRATKFVRRHRMGVAVAAAFLLLILGFGGTMAAQRDQMARERDAARKGTSYITKLYMSAIRPLSRELLEKNVADVEQLKDLPDVQAAALAVIGKSYQLLGLMDEAIPLLEQSITIQRGAHAEDSSDLIVSMNLLALSLQSVGDYERAEAIVREILSRNRQRGQFHSAVAASLNRLSIILMLQGEYEEAEPLAREALDLRRRLKTHPEIAQSLDTLGQVLTGKGDYATAEETHRESLELRRELWGNLDHHVGYALNSLAELYMAQGEYDRAGALLEEARATYDGSLSRYYSLAARVLHNLGIVRHHQGDPEAAEQLLGRALDLRRGRLGPEHPEVIETLQSLAIVLSSKAVVEPGA